jgi:hypothetical protein
VTPKRTRRSCPGGPRCGDVDGDRRRCAAVAVARGQGKRRDRCEGEERVPCQATRAGAAKIRANDAESVGGGWTVGGAVGLGLAGTGGGWRGRRWPGAAWLTLAVGRVGAGLGPLTPVARHCYCGQTVEVGWRCSKWARPDTPFQLFTGFSNSNQADPNCKI